MDENFWIGAEDAGTRADAWVAARLGISRSQAQKRLENATLHDESGAPKTFKPSYGLRAGDHLCLPAPTAPETETFITDFVLGDEHVIWEDDDLIVINKPRGLVVHAGAGETGPTLVDGLRGRGTPLSSIGAPERPGIVHRLDKDTSGVMVVAKTDVAHAFLASAFEAREVGKRYFALVCGAPPERGRVEAPIARHATHRKKMMIAAHGRPSLTEFSVEKRWPRFAALDVKLLTGRTHQIRVHLAHLHFPVAGDPLYGGFHRALDCAPNDAVRAALEQLNAQALHAHYLTFSHPTSGRPLEFEAPLAPEIAALVTALDQAF